tara:strand:- start:1928 stop:4078 length:2151 start_codon:yes stop_codon:yes gene_type:complete
MKTKLLAVATIFLRIIGFSQVDYYGPESFGEILDNSFSQTWTPSAVASIDNKKYVVILDQATKSNVIALNSSAIETIDVISLTDITRGTYGSMMRSIFQLVDENTHQENDAGGGSGTYTPLSGLYKANPIMHSYFSLNSTSSFGLNSTDGGTFYVSSATNTGYLLLEFTGTASSTAIKAVEQWTYNTTSGANEENTAWTDKYLMLNGSTLSWTTAIGSATNFYLADATDLLDMEIAAGSEFNPLSVAYQPNATAEIPSGIKSMEDSKIINLSTDLDESYHDQLGNSITATTAAMTVVDAIETTLISEGASLRYPKEFYLAVRENMLSHTIQSSDIYNGIVGKNTIEHVYFTNASDDAGVPHPFMVIAAHAVSTRPNLLVDVNRPPGAEMGVGYAQSSVTRNGKLGDFIIKIPLKDYGLTSTLLDNDLSPYGDLASEYDAKHNSTTTKSVYNYVALASIGVAVDGVTIYPAQNNNLRFAVEDAEVTSSGIHVGGGLELHYHSDGHAYNGNGINLYNIADFTGKNHPPAIGMAYDGIALFGKYESSFASMLGYGTALDEFGGHDHDGFGYHYHAHTQSVTSSVSPNPVFDEHILLVGAWKGNINNIPAFDYSKSNQLKEDDAISRYAGVSYATLGVKELLNNDNTALIYPSPTKDKITIEVLTPFDITITNSQGAIVRSFKASAGANTISLEGCSNGIYFIEGVANNNRFIKKMIVKK